MKAGERAIKQGEMDDTLFFVKSGRFSVTRDEAPTVHLEDPGPGSILGEIAVLTGEPRSATVTAIEPSTVYRVPGDTFRDVVNEHEELSQQLRSLTHQRLSHAEKTVKTAQIESQKKIPSKTDEVRGVAT